MYSWIHQMVTSTHSQMNLAHIYAMKLGVSANPFGAIGQVALVASNTKSHQMSALYILECVRRVLSACSLVRWRKAGKQIYWSTQRWTFEMNVRSLQRPINEGFNSQYDWAIFAIWNIGLKLQEEAGNCLFFQLSTGFGYDEIVKVESVSSFMLWQRCNSKC